MLHIYAHCFRVIIHFKCKLNLQFAHRCVHQCDSAKCVIHQQDIEEQGSRARSGRVRQGSRLRPLCCSSTLWSLPLGWGWQRLASRYAVSTSRSSRSTLRSTPP